MKILMVHHGKGIGGAPKSMSYLAKGLIERGYLVEILFLQASDATSLFDEIDCDKYVSKVPIYYFYHMSKWVRLWQVHKLVSQLVSVTLQTFFVAPYYILKTKPDIVYINTSVIPEWAIVSKFLGKKVVVHIRETLSEGHFGIRSFLISTIINSFADLVISISKYNKSKIKGIGKAKSLVAYNYERLPTINSSYKKIYDFIYVGGESEIKGWKVMEFLIRSNPLANFVLAGEYSDNTKRNLLLLPNVNIIGVVPNVYEYIKQSRFLLSPFAEPHFSRPVIEAYAYGAVPLATFGGGSKEQVVDGITGFLFNKSDFKSANLVVRTCLNLNDSEYFCLLSNGKKLFRDRFSSSNEAEIINLIAEV
ncbi:glycosyltransferase [Psychrobacter sp. CCUG 69069]|uniref:glycosyltransferase family 4 protein n=1 Tax=Psychrobacter sp. CCUG 69069 TaxID=2282777 RepID=UPI001E57886A|nr:glycosyltransferase family 4 protein [Psychrobacter sp. CCUG 69069]MCD1279116.1 glycosyltransferase [Psychrobacter sp. CCUG 69069]